METDKKKDIKSFTLSQLKDEMESMGEKPFRAKQLYEWMHNKLAVSYEEMTNIPKTLSDKCMERYSYPSGTGVTDRRHQKIPFRSGRRQYGGKRLDAL